MNYSLHPGGGENQSRTIFQRRAAVYGRLGVEDWGGGVVANGEVVWLAERLGWSGVVCGLESRIC